MRKAKLRIIVGLVAGLTFCVTPAQADTEGGPLRKLGRGAANLATGWLELPFQILRTTEGSGAFAGASVGFTRGLAFGVGRTLVGALEVVSFPLPNPTTGYRPIIEPEFVTFRDADRW